MDASAGGILEAEELGRKIDSAWIWRGVSLTLRAGERLALTGPSGSGKSLLLRTLAGLDPVDEGNIRLEGRPIEAWPMPRYRARLGYVQQRPSLLPGTVESNFRRVLRFAVHEGKRLDHERIQGWLDHLGKPASFLQQPAEELSGGEAEIAALLRSLIAAPRILLLDEPTSSLDRQQTHLFESLVVRWLEEDPGRACIWVSHDDAQIERVSTRRFPLRDEAR